MDVTVEYATPGETTVMAEAAILQFKNLCTKHNLKIVEYKEKE
jgi:hypothetical protein